MLASRALEELGDRVLMIAADQRGSKPLERVLKRADTETFGKVFAVLIEALPELAPNQYASHVLESAIASWTDRLGSGDEASRLSAEPVVALCKVLKQDGGWPALVDDACASHVVRSLILALGGYVPTPQDKGKANARAGFLPELRRDMPAEVAACRREVAAELVALLRQDDALCLSTHASPVVQLLLRVLRDRGDRVLVAEANTAITGATSRGKKPSAERLDALARSAPGSRALEAVLETASAEAASTLFVSYFRPKLRALSGGEAGEFGAYLAQRVADGLVDEPQLASALAEIDFAACLNPSVPAPQQAIVGKVLEACLRLRACLKQAASQVFKAFGLHNSSEHHRVWPTLLALEDVGNPADLLRSPAASRRGGVAGAKASDAGTGRCSAAAEVDEPSKLRPLPSAGSQILATLMRFPVEAVQPLNGGLPGLFGHRELLAALAREARTARVLEAALAPSSAILPKLRLKLTRSFKGLLASLGPHPVGGWVCAALWRCSLGDTALRAAFAEELLTVEERLRADNFAVWKVCGLNQAKTQSEAWQQQQQKAGKTQRLFGELLEGGDAEAAKAAIAARKRAAEEAAEREAEVRADPVVAGLLPAPELEELDSAPPQLDAGAAEPPTDGRKRGKKRKTREAPAQASSPAESAGSEAGPGLAPPAGTRGSGGVQPGSGDASLQEALQLIAGRAPSRNAARKRRKAAAAAAAAAAAGESGAAAPPQVPATGGARPRKKRRKGAAPP